MKTSIIFHLEYKGKDSPHRALLESILLQSSKQFDIILLGEASKSLKEKLSHSHIPFKECPWETSSLGKVLNKAFKGSDSDFFLYIDNRQSDIILKNAALEGFEIAQLRNPSAGLIYSDYELESEGMVKEIHLLNHHIGRVRDNQDYGFVWFIPRRALEKIAYCDESLNYHYLYDLRLKLSEVSKVIRLSNKYAGSYYRILVGEKKANVFDYLLAGKESQKEAEKIVSGHLKRLNAYLKPGQFRKKERRGEKTYPLKASVIIPVGQRPEFIGIAIDSIQAQTIKDIEAVIVVNGGDHDPTISEVKKYMAGGEKYDPAKAEVRLIVVDINSIGLCLNLGVNAARGRYYIQLDSDDRLKNDAVEKILRTFEQSPQIGMVIGSYEVWEKQEDGSLSRMEDIPVVTHDEWTDDNGRNNLLRINGAGAPRAIAIDIIKEMGYFGINDDAYARNYGEDYEMVNKVAEYYKIGRIYDAIYEVVRHSGGTDHSISQDLIDRNDEAKDDMRREIILRRIAWNTGKD